MQHTLVVIDMQPFFPASDKALDECKRAVRLFSLTKNDIIFVEFISCGETHKSLRDIAKNVATYRVFKSQMGGGDEVVACITRNDLAKNLVVCGVNTSACVQETVFELRMKKYNTSIYVPGCADANKNLHYVALNVKPMCKQQITSFTNLQSLISNRNSQGAFLQLT